MERRRLILAARILVIVVVAAGIALVARSLNWDEVFAAFGKAQLPLVLVGLVVGLPCSALQGLRWGAVLQPLRRMPWSTPVAAVYVGQAASAFLPMRAGEAVRMELLSRATGLPRTQVVGSVALDAVVNALVMFVMAAALPLLLPLPKWMAVVFWVGVVLLVAAVAVLVRLAQHPEEVSERSRLGHLLVRLRGGLVALRNPRTVLPAFGFATASWCLEIAGTALVLAAFSLPHDIPHAMAVLFGVNLALVIPSPPASLGNFELGASVALVAFGGDKERAAAFAIGLHAMQLLPTLVMGGLLVGRFRNPKRRKTDNPGTASVFPSTSAGAGDRPVQV